MNLPDDRKRLRQQLRQARRALSPNLQLQAAQKVALRLCRHPWLRRAQNVAAYLAADGELNPTPIIKWSLARGQQIYLPCLTKRTGHLAFRPWQAQGRTQANTFGILEPTVGAAVGIGALDVILVPLVGFDRRGNRLGMGGGYYDRTLAKVAFRPNLKLVGLAHGLQEVKALPRASWDIPLDLVATEHELIYGRSPKR